MESILQPYYLYLVLHPGLFFTLVILFSLIVGSFLNVVIYRLPLIMEREWRTECIEFLFEVDKTSGEAPLLNAEQAEKVLQRKEETFTIARPRSRCPHCKTMIRAWENIPILSFIFLGGKCAHCKQAISWRYPIVEALSVVLTVIAAILFGVSWITLAAAVLSWSLIALSFIDFDHQLLPDSITLSLLWLGLFISLFDSFVGPHDAIIGALLGYGVLWIIAWAFKHVTGREGMGHGDFKLIAVFGAWFGWQMLPLIVLLASILGAVVGISVMLIRRQKESIPIPFGPYIALAGWISLCWGPSINQAYLTFVTGV